MKTSSFGLNGVHHVSALSASVLRRRSAERLSLRLSLEPRRLEIEEQLKPLTKVPA